MFFVSFLKIATVVSATATWKFAGIRSIGWVWTGVIWLYNIVIYILLDPLKFCVRYALSGKAWDLVLNKKVSKFILLLLSFHALSDPLLNYIHSGGGFLFATDCIHNPERLR